MNVVSVFYILNFIGNAGVGFFRGIGDLKVTLMSSFTNMAVRVIAAAPMILLWNFGIEALPYSYLAGFATGIGWISVVLYQIVVYRKVRKQEFC